MKKKEWVYREILHQVLDLNENFLTQRFLSEKCEVSIGDVNHAIQPLQEMNAIEKKPRGFQVIEPKKILLYWASTRRLDKDIVYKGFSDKPVDEIEKTMPECMFTAYSGFKFRFDFIPSDYSEVFVYADEEKIKERFPEKKGRANIIVLKTDKHLKKFKQAPLGQLFVDLWNINTWYAREFLKSLEAKIDGILE